MKNEIEEKLRYINLLDIYYNLLSPSQKKIMNAYFNLDLSLGEIASELNISRAGALDSIRKAKRKLDEYENELHIYEKQVKINEYISKLKDFNLNDEAKRLIDLIEKENNDGV